MENVLNILNASLGKNFLPHGSMIIILRQSSGIFKTNLFTVWLFNGFLHALILTRCHRNPWALFTGFPFLLYPSIFKFLSTINLMLRIGCTCSIITNVASEIQGIWKCYRSINVSKTTNSKVKVSNYVKIHLPRIV